MEENREIQREVVYLDGDDEIGYAVYFHYLCIGDNTKLLYGSGNLSISGVGINTDFTDPLLLERIKEMCKKRIRSKNLS